VKTCGEEDWAEESMKNISHRKVKKIGGHIAHALLSVPLPIPLFPADYPVQQVRERRNSWREGNQKIKYPWKETIKLLITHKAQLYGIWNTIAETMSRAGKYLLYPTITTDLMKNTVINALRYRYINKMSQNWTSYQSQD
jgi:hypothetical protein